MLAFTSSSVDPAAPAESVKRKRMILQYAFQVEPEALIDGHVRVPEGESMAHKWAETLPINTDQLRDSLQSLPVAGVKRLFHRRPCR